MKTFLQITVTAIGVIVFAFGMMYFTRLFSNATTPITLSSPKPGITCAAMVTADGAAMSCWKD